MKMQNKNHQKSVLIVVAVVLVLLGGGLLIYKRTHTSKNVVPTQSSGPTAEQKQAETETNAATKQNFIEGSKPTGSLPTGQPPTPNIELSAQQESNGSVTVFTKLHDITSGTCSLLVQNDGKQNTQPASIIYQPEYSICAGFSVPISALGAGSWNIVLTVTNSGQTYTKNIIYDIK